MKVVLLFFFYIFSFLPTFQVRKEKYYLFFEEKGESKNMNSLKYFDDGVLSFRIGGEFFRYKNKTDTLKRSVLPESRILSLAQLKKQAYERISRHIDTAAPTGEFYVFAKDDVVGVYVIEALDEDQVLVHKVVWVEIAE